MLEVKSPPSNTTLRSIVVNDPPTGLLDENMVAIEKDFARVEKTRGFVARSVLYREGIRACWGK